MGCPLAPVLANIFMGFYESKWLNKYNINYYFQLYIELVFAIFVLHYCINLKFHHLIIALIVAIIDFHAIYLLSKFVMLHFKVN